MTDKLDDKGFLQRWSNRKTDVRDGIDVDEAEGTAVVAVDAPEEEPVAQIAPEDLPDVETLDADSDYTMFLGENVPQDLAKLALRKLWRSDPLLANLDGLNDYDEDFSKVGMVTEVVKTAYKVGKGFLTEEDEDKESQALEEPVAVDASNDEVSENEEDASTTAEADGEDEPAEFHNAEFAKTS